MPYEVPKGYFDTLANRIQQKEEQNDTRKNSHWIYAIAAGFALLVSLGWYFNNNSSSSAPEDFLTKVSDESIIFYLQNSELTIEELTEYSEVTSFLKEEQLPDFNLEDEVILQEYFDDTLDI